MTEIHPPISTRTTKQLLEIVETKEQWKKEVIELAQKELIRRGVPIKTQETRRTIRQNLDRRIENAKARSTYTVGEKILIVLFGPVLAVILSPALFYGGPGYKKKNRQGIFYLLLGVGFWALMFYAYHSIND